MPEKPLDMHGDQPGSDASLSTNRPPFHRCSREGEDDPLARSGRPVSGLPRSRPITASQETCHACRARSPHLGNMPVASTEVVLAERLNSARPGAARWGGAFSVPFYKVFSASFAEYAVPPSVLPDISPTRGEIDEGRDHRPISIVLGSAFTEPISPLVGEMSGRTEGGVTPSEAKEIISGTCHRGALSRRSAWA